MIDDPHCWYCGLSLSIDNATLDHLKPRVAGGRTRASNLRLACKRCNHAKGSALLPQIACVALRGAGIVRILSWPARALRAGPAVFPFDQANVLQPRCAAL
jgi:hypothetical protein